ncbi:ABC transporter substrate-binding protein [Nocardiopsis coralliicola]
MPSHRPLALLGCAVLVLAAGCSGGGQGTAAVPRSGTEECPPLTGDVAESESFTWMYSVGNSSFDPDAINTNNSLMYLFPVYDSLVHIDEQGVPQPMLAEDWEVGDGGDTLRMDLISDWEYHDGEPFDADSVVANIERAKEPGSFNENALRIVTGVEAEDDGTVVFTTDGAAGALVGVLGGAPGMMMSPAVMDDEGQGLAPTGGSGAYEMTEYVSGSRVVYTAVDDYWDPDAQNTAEMVFLISGDDNARLNAVATGSADAVFLRASMYGPAKEEGLVLCEQPSLSAYNLNLNTERSEFASREVRAALNHAIDRESVSAMTDGFCEPAIQSFPDWYYAHGDTVDPADFAYDPDRARALLADAGLAEGFSFELEVINLQLYQQIAEVVQANLADIGVTMEIRPVEIDAMGENFSVHQTADASLSEQKAEADPSILTSSYFLQDGFNNPGGWGTPEIAELNDAAMAGATPEERSGAYDELFAAVADEVAPSISLCHLTTPFAMNDQVKGMEIYADGSRQFRGVGMEPSG